MKVDKRAQIEAFDGMRKKRPTFHVNNQSVMQNVSKSSVAMKIFSWKLQLMRHRGIHETKILQNAMERYFAFKEYATSK